jgi:hypothetical protein
MGCEFLAYFSFSFPITKIFLKSEKAKQNQGKIVYFKNCIQMLRDLHFIVRMRIVEGF